MRERCEPLPIRATFGPVSLGPPLRPLDPLCQPPRMQYWWPVQSIINRFIYNDEDDQLDRLLGRPLKMNWVDDELTSLQERFFFNAFPLFASRKNKDEHYSGSSNDQQQQDGEYQQAWSNIFLPVVVVAVLLFLAQRRALFYYHIRRSAKIIVTVRRETCDDGSHSNNIRSSSSHGQHLPNAEPLQMDLLDQRFNGGMNPAI
jgi:hypothetical protein